mgnify:CR=1 FL=1
MQRRKTLLIISIILLFALACNLNDPASPTPSSLEVDGGIETAVMETLRASGVMLATPEHTITPSVTPPPTSTPLPTFTPTPSIPMAGVSVDTSCRSGPGKIYDYLGALMVGETAEVVGKRTSHKYWIIKNPDGVGECWLWGEYASINGNIDHLTEYYVPAIPTPAIPAAPTNFTVSSKNCGTLMDITLSWIDNSNNEDGFSLYKNNGQTHIVGYNHTAVALALPYQLNVPIQFDLASFNVTGESAKQIIQVACP